MSEIQSNLVPGSVWQRQKKNGVANNTVLLVTNAGCSEKVLAVHPQQVVFLTESYQVLSMSVQDFLQGRVYAGIDDTVAATVDLLTTEAEEIEEVDIDSVQADDKLFEAMLEDKEEVDATEEAPAIETEDEVVSATLSFKVGAHASAERLESSLIAYSEGPYHTGDTLHTLRFTLDNGLTLAEVAKAFVLSDPNAIQSFVVTTNRETINVAVDAYVDTLYEATTFEDSIVLYVLSEGNFREVIAEPAPEVVIEQHIEPAPEVDSNTITITVS